MVETQNATTYPAKEQYDRWKDHADRLDMTVSEFMQAMIEAGRRKFERDVSPDETVQELREERDELRQELLDARERVQELEEQAFDAERRQVAEYVAGNPGAEFEGIVGHVRETAPVRVSRHIDALEGEEIPENL